MKKAELVKLANKLMKTLIDNGYTNEESGAILITIGELIKDIKCQTSKD